MLKVLQLYYEPQPSGQTAHVLSLARGLDRRRYQVMVALPNHLEWPIAAFEQLGIRTAPLPLRNRLWSPPAVMALARLLRMELVDILHIHSQEAGLLARAVARLTGVPVIIYTPQTIDIRRSQWRALYTLWERTAAHFTDRIISVNEADRQRLIQWGIPARKVVTIPNGIDVSALAGPYKVPMDSSGLRTALGLEPTRPVVMQVGRLSAQKDPLTFVAGAARVVRACPDAQFVLIGDGPLRDRLVIDIQQRRLEGHIHLAGWQDRAQQLMAAADVVTLTSRWEGMPYALLEAMAWGRPVVATAVNGCPEVVVDGVTGFLVSPGDPAAWARRVLDLLENPAQAVAFGQHGRRRAEEQFALSQLIARLESLYDLCLQPTFTVQ